MQPEDTSIPQPVSNQPISDAAVQQDATIRTSVLCIEDEHFISELYVRALTNAGYFVKNVIDGNEGLKEAKTNQYDIILLDIMLPNMNGMEILDELRDPAKTPDFKAKIIITTNLDQGEEGRAAVESKADGYIVKAEVTPKQLVSFLQQLNI